MTAVPIQLLALYAAIGICVALGFVSVGAGQVLGRQTSFTLGARLLLLPGAAALWPYVLYRWLAARMPAKDDPKDTQ